MRQLILVVFVAINVFLYGQDEELILDRFQSSFQYENFGNDHVPCPWQSWRIIGNLSFQIDLVVDEVALRVLEKEPWLLQRDLLDIFYGYPFSFSRLELIQRFYSAKRKYIVHIPGLTIPYYRKWEPVSIKYALITDKSPYFGWHYRDVGEGLAVAVKDLGNGEWQVSAAFFVRPIDPNAQAALLAAQLFGIPHW